MKHSPLHPARQTLRVLAIAVPVIALTLGALASGTIGAQVPPYVAAVLVDNPVAYWRLGEPFGPTAVDIAGVPQNGTYTGTVTFGQSGAISGDPDTAIRVGPSLGYVNVPHDPTLGITSNLTIEAWVNPATLAGVPGIVSKTLGNCPAPYDVYLTSGRVNFLWGNGFCPGNIPLGSVTSTNPLVAGVWQHVVIVFQGNTVTHYLNGQPNGTGTGNPGAADAGRPFRIANRDDLVTQLNGCIDEVAIYASALSATQIQAHYAAGTAAGQNVACAAAAPTPPPTSTSFPNPSAPPTDTPTPTATPTDTPTPTATPTDTPTPTATPTNTPTPTPTNTPTPTSTPTPTPPALPQGGAFVIGDLEATVGSSVTFWSAQWAKENDLSGGSAPNSFKGFENSNSSPSCGGTWTSRPGNSSNPPSTVPSAMAVIAASDVNQGGSTISGDIRKVVVVQVDPGYGPSPGHEGTGRVIAMVCG